jgi:hypothetical protein
MGQRTMKRIKKVVKELFESGREPKNDAENKILVAALHARPLVQYKKDEDQTDVPDGKIRMKEVVLSAANPLRVAQRSALKKLSLAEQRSLFE